MSYVLPILLLLFPQVREVRWPEGPQVPEVRNRCGLSWAWADGGVGGVGGLLVIRSSTLT